MSSVMFFCIYLILLQILISPSIFCRSDRYYPEKLGKSYFEGSVPLNTSISDSSGYILPTVLKPTLYNLTILPILNSATFKGWVTIRFNVNTPTKHVVLNSRFESINASSLSATIFSKSQDLAIINTTADVVHQLITFTLNTTLVVQDDVEISIAYNGILANDMMGFYLSTYNTTDSSGARQNHLMAITQFESTFARRAFPCFDEPQYRARFIINIYRGLNQSSMSNMPIESSIFDAATGMVLDSYQPTPLIPTYLVAFGVSDLANRTDGKTYHVFSRSAVLQYTTYAVSIGQKILDKIGNFTGISYPLPKMDVVAVPDFSAGAMENWGLTTYREKYVIYNQQLNSWRDKFQVLSVIAHEFGHQWFGDLVTPQWWSYAWLNEAFATYFEYTIPNQVAPEWNMGSEMYVVDALQYALNVDIGNPRPMTSPVVTPDQIENLFDYVIYEKGGSVLRMVENFLTTPVWQDGLNKYLLANEYGTGTPEELFSALEQSTNKNGNTAAVKTTLQQWTTQPGYPLVTVQKIRGIGIDDMYYITQVPYALNASFSNLTWNIPLTYTTKDEPEFNASKTSNTWFYPPNPLVIAINTSGWVLFNVDQVGFYRVNYDENNWAKLADQLTSNFSVIGSINRAQILDDAFHLAHTGHLNYSIALNLTRYLTAETSFAPWNAFFVNMRYLINQFYNTPTGDGLQKYARNIMAGPFAALTANLSTSTSTFLGALTLQAAAQFTCDVGFADCESLAKAVFEKWRQSNSQFQLLPEIKQAVICTGLRLDSTFEAYQYVLDYYLNSANGAEQLTILNAMGCLTNETSITRYLNIVCDDNANYIRRQDRFIAFRSLVSRQSGILPGLQYLSTNFNKVSNALGSRVYTVINTLASTISQESHLKEVQRLVNDTMVDSRLRDLLNTLVIPEVSKRQVWASTRQASDLKTWVENNVPSSASSTVFSILFLVVTSMSVFY